MNGVCLRTMIGYDKAFVHERAITGIAGAEPCSAFLERDGGWLGINFWN